MFKCSTVHPGCEYKAPTGKQWKIHATRSHGGWSDTEYLEVARAGSKPAGTEFTDVPPVTETPQPAPAPADPAVPEIPFAEMRAKFAQALAAIAWAPLENYFKVPKLGEDDKRTLAEGFEAALSIYNVQPDFQPIEKKLRSPMWAIMFPIISLVIVLTKKVSLDQILSKLDQTKDKPNRGPDSPKGKGKDDTGPGSNPPDPPFSGIRLPQ